VFFEQLQCLLVDIVHARVEVGVKLNLA